MGEINKVLKNDFRLSNSEILIINHLVDNIPKKFTADEICETLKLPKGKIYDLLNVLEDKNFVKVEYKTPKLYYIDNLKQSIESAFDTEEKSLLEKERKIMAELRSMNKKQLDIKIIASDEELYLIRQKEVMRCKEYRKSSFNPYILIEDETPRRKYRQNVLDTIIENNVDLKWVITSDKLSDFKIPRVVKILKDILKYDNIDIRLSKIIPSFDVCNDAVFIRTTHATGGPYIFIRSKEFAEESAKVFDNIFNNAYSIKKIIK